MMIATITQFLCTTSCIPSNVRIARVHTLFNIFLFFLKKKETFSFLFSSQLFKECVWFNKKNIYKLSFFIFHFFFSFSSLFFFYCYIHNIEKKSIYMLIEV